MTYNKKVDLSGYYTKVEVDNKITNIKPKPMFGADDKVGTIGTINDGVYNVPWIIYNISGNTYQLFPMKNLGEHAMNSTDTNVGGYPATAMYTFVHNTVLPNLKRSGLNIAACDLVSSAIYIDIFSKTSMTSNEIAGGSDYFWLADIYPGASFSFYFVTSGGNINYGKSEIGATTSYGVRPLITVVM